MASGRAIARWWPAADGKTSTESLIAAANNGQKDAVAILDRIADHLASAVYLLAITFDVDHIVFGGGVAEVGPPLLKTISAALGRLAGSSAFVRSLDLSARIALEPAGALGVFGAAALAWDGGL